MSQNLEYELDIRKADKHKNLYSWYITQLNDNGEEVGFLTDKCIPFEGLVSFIFKNISFTSTIELDSTEIPEDSFKRQISENSKFEKSEYIGGALVYDPNDSVQTQFSMFGTDRIIENIYLNIYKSDHSSCFLSGYVSRTDEFEGFTSPDQIFIKLSLVTSSGIKSNLPAEIAPDVTIISVSEFFNFSKIFLSLFGLLSFIIPPSIILKFKFSPNDLK